MSQLIITSNLLILDDTSVDPVLTDHSSTPVAALMAVKNPSIVLTSIRCLHISTQRRHQHAIIIL